MKAFQFHLSQGVVFEESASGYVFLSALSRVFPFLHGQSNVQIAPIRGTRLMKAGHLATDRSSVLHVRGITDAQAQEMAGQTIQVQGQPCTLSPPQEKLLVPYGSVVSRLVVFDDAVQADAFLARAAYLLPPGVGLHLGRQRGVQIKNFSYRGFGLRVSGLTLDQGLTLQAQGLGKYTSMGCGVFAPATKETA
jgi:CRISPR-associated protein Cas6